MNPPGDFFWGPLNNARGADTHRSELELVASAQKVAFRNKMKRKLQISFYNFMENYEVDLDNRNEI